MSSSSDQDKINHTNSLAKSIHHQEQQKDTKSIASFANISIKTGKFISMFIPCMHIIIVIIGMYLF